MQYYLLDALTLIDLMQVVHAEGPLVRRLQSLVSVDPGKRTESAETLVEAFEQTADAPFKDFKPSLLLETASALVRASDKLDSLHLVTASQSAIIKTAQDRCEQLQTTLTDVSEQLRLTRKLEPESPATWVPLASNSAKALAALKAEFDTRNWSRDSEDLRHGGYIGANCGFIAANRLYAAVLSQSDSPVEPIANNSAAAQRTIESVLKERGWPGLSIEAAECGFEAANRVYSRIFDEVKTAAASDTPSSVKPATPVPLAPTPGDEFIVLPRKMDEDLYYLVGGALGAQSPEQCGRADPFWAKLVSRADAEATAERARRKSAVRPEQ